MIGLVDGNNFFVSCEQVFDRSLVGKPVAVLSNNDGCCVAMSKEFKALGIPRGTPYFQLKDREARDGLVFRSSNYELYGDMSRRIIEILREEADEVEQYSIDEAFIVPPPAERMPGAAPGTGDEEARLLDYGKALRKKILRWTGIPCGVGFAPTKTLAKIANHIGKKLPEGVYALPDDPTEILASLPASEVWGVGRRLTVKLRASRIASARDLRDARDDDIRKVGGVGLLRTAMELRGIPCNQDRDYDADPESVSCSRSFGEIVTKIEGLSESIATFVAKGAEKLRRHGLVAAGCNIYAQTAVPRMYETRSGGEMGFVGTTVMFDYPTDATNEMLAAVGPEVEKIYVPGTKYRKSGMVFFGLEPAGAARQLDLFEEARPAGASANSRLFKAVDALNARLGSGKVFSAAEGIGRNWKMKRSLLSRRPTTCWSEIITAK